MLDIRRIREDYENVKAAVERRCKGDYGISQVLPLDARRRELLLQVEQMKNKQNTVSKEIPKLKKAGEDTTAIMAYMIMAGIVGFLMDRIVLVLEGILLRWTR